MMKQLIVIDSILLSSESRKRRRYECPCNDERCCTDDILNALGCKLDWHKYNEIYNDAVQAIGKAPNQIPTTFKLRACLAVDAEFIQSQSDTDEPTSCSPTFISKQSQGRMIILPRSIQPLISITLCPILNDVKSNTDVFANPLLRSCVKRLLVGRRIVHHETEGAETATSFNTALTVCVPSNRNRNEKISLGYRVTNIRAKTDHSELCQFVILPSTRIVFQASIEKKDDSVDVQTQITCKSTARTLAASEPKSRSIPPHQHLLEALHSILTFSSAPNNPPILRSFLFSGPPGMIDDHNNANFIFCLAKTCI